jgi:hypothetical protein
LKCTLFTHHLWPRSCLKNLIFQHFQNCFRIALQLTLPCGQDPPPGTFQLRLLFPVPLYCPAKLLCPEPGSRLRHRGTRTPLVTMPEAPVNEDNRAVLRENDVRFSRQAGRMQPKAKAFPVEKATKENFGFCVFAPDSGHVPAAVLFRNPVGHASPSFI